MRTEINIVIDDENPSSNRIEVNGVECVRFCGLTNANIALVPSHEPEVRLEADGLRLLARASAVARIVASYEVKP